MSLHGASARSAAIGRAPSPPDLLTLKPARRNARSTDRLSNAVWTVSTSNSIEWK
jgi:hypothetical protein